MHETNTTNKFNNVGGYQLLTTQPLLLLFCWRSTHETVFLLDRIRTGLLQSKTNANMSTLILRLVLPYFLLIMSLPPGENPSLVARHHGSTLSWTIPQEQNPQGQADENPKEPKVNNFQTLTNQTLPRTIPQEQNPQGKAHEDPKEPEMNNFQCPHEEAQQIVICLTFCTKVL